MSSTYNKDIAVCPCDPSPSADASYSATISHSWRAHQRAFANYSCQVTRCALANSIAPYNGYLLAIAFNAILSLFEGLDNGTPWSLDVSYLKPGTPGPCRIDITILATTPTRTVARATITQPPSSSPTLYILATFIPSNPHISLALTSPSPASGPTIALISPASTEWSLPPRDQCSRVGARMEFKSEDGECVTRSLEYFAAPRGEQGLEARAWVGLPGRPCNDWRAVGIFLDVMLVFRKGWSTGASLPFDWWYPTAELHVVFNRPPDPTNTYLQVRHLVTAHLADGRHVVEGEVRDEEGVVVASVRSQTPSRCQLNPRRIAGVVAKQAASFDGARAGFNSAGFKWAFWAAPFKLDSDCEDGGGRALMLSPPV
ncbi:thioesterase-like superfamily-domain-containing protein [Blyttiomyces helicus]|uniref:Thioesterase-like superfamily-domain-containing protein n=1 Tax=Blyttiomyces helicus TaxID=388810 RepID=A0A4P9W9J4_9FUNG|nr:thioesterase-like superfamily-domain-containing protein [Blyttiomyces helicus]|eukprot:RKO89074.1 thioesterase-like superfamily-domain-containing protein [Blyttiomyces helicus]